jgi:excisionase family DNA binding protein
MSARLSATRPIPRRGLSREEAAMYVGVSTTKFDELVKSGRMPVAQRVDGRKVWDVHKLDAAFDGLPDDTPNGKASSWDDA